MGRTGAEMYADSIDPRYYQLARNTGEDHDDWFPPIVADHKDDDGNWYSWECSSGNFDGSIEDFFQYVDEWTASNQPGLRRPARPAVALPGLADLERHRHQRDADRPADVTRTGDRALTVLEAQAVAGNPWADD